MAQDLVNRSECVAYVRFCLGLAAHKRFEDKEFL